MSRVLAFALTALLLSLAQSATAQQITLRDAAIEMLRADLRDRVISTDTLLDFPTYRLSQGRLDRQAGVWRARYRIDDRVPAGLGSGAAALSHIARSAEEYGVRRPDEHLRVERVVKGRYTRHVALRQTLAGVPVYGRRIKVSLDRTGQPTMVINGYEPHLDTVADFDPRPVIGASRAIRIVQTASERGLHVSEPELVAYPSKPPRLAWQMTARLDALPIEYEVLVDARTGEIIRMLDITLHSDGFISREELDALLAAEPTPAVIGAPSTSAMPGQDASTTAVQMVDGMGWVFDPDPVSSAGVEYGGAFVDNNDADLDVLTNQLFTVTLRDIAQGPDQLYRLQGPFVIVDGSSSAYTPPAEAAPDAFTYTRADDRFEAVMAYYHIDKSQRYVQSLDVGFPIKESPIRVNPQGRSDDESNYSPSENLIRLGTGGIDDAEDADVIWHEYAHALLYDTAPDIPLGNTEGGAFHEGWSDYWAASYSRYLSEEDEQIPPHNWRRLFNWDGNNGCWMGRDVDHPGRYPNDLYYPTEGCVGARYQEGLLWATTLMDIYPLVGRNVIDRLSLASHAYLGAPFSFTDAAEALIQADYDLYGGEHTSILIEQLSARGYIDEGSYGPFISHEPLPHTEQIEGTVSIEVTAIASTAAVDSVIVHYGLEGLLSGRAVLEHESGDLYTGELQLPGEAGTVSYYIMAIDEEGRRRVLPVGAPAELFSFDIGPDLIAPTIVHDPLQQISVIGWPVDLYAEVHDNLEVDSVWVEFVIEVADGTVAGNDAFGLTYDNELYVGRFPDDAGPIEEGGVVSYRIVAQDAAASPNTTILPESGMFRVPFVEQGVLRVFDFEGIVQGEEATGVWERGEPTFGLEVAWSGSRVWATDPDDAYPAGAQRSTLTLPEMNLAAFDEVYLIFWHWYDFEHDGVQAPATFYSGAALWDGGNIKVSTDGGETWIVANPLDGYSGIVSSAYGNPLAGEEAFGGYSFGWRRVIVPLPGAESVRIRFDFGTDQGNQQQSKFFAGWYIDDVMITTILPDDSTPPEALHVPEALIVRTQTEQDPPFITVEALDDTGIEAVLSEFVVISDGIEYNGSTRLAMAETDPRVFTGPVTPFGSFAPGDQIRYTILIRDFDGNEVRYGDPFLVEYRSESMMQALTSATSTGAWARQGAGWRVATTGGSATSSLIIQPFVLPENAESTDFILEHSYRLGDGLGGNVKLSIDGGRTWSVLEPASGYPALLSSDHPMRGEAVFSDSSGARTSTFDLSAYGGQEIRLRLDLAHPRELAAGESWTIQSAAFRSLSADPEVTTVYDLKLHANFPDPVVHRTTITYSIPERMPVRLSIYDMLGRRVSILRHANHDAGIYTLTFEPDGLAAGAYLIFMETPNGTQTEPMVVLR